MTLPFVLKALRHHAVVLITCVMIGVIAGIALTSFMPKKYSSTAQLLLTVNAPAGTDISVANSYVSDRIPTYAEFATSNVVLEAASTSLENSVSPKLLASNVAVSVETNTVILSITSTWASPRMAARITNAVAGAFADLAPSMDGEDHSPTLHVEVIDRATAEASEPASSSLELLLIGILSGGVLGVISAIILELRNPYARTLSEYADAAGAPVVAAFEWRTRRRRRRGKQIATLTDKLYHKNAVLGRSMQELYARLDLNSAGAKRQIRAVTATECSTQAAEIAWELAKIAVASGVKCVIAPGNEYIHQDLLSRQYGLARRPADRIHPLIMDVVRNWSAHGVLSTETLSKALEEAASSADLVLMALPPVADSPDTFSYLKFVDEGVLVVAPHVRCRSAGLSSTAMLVADAGSNMSGVVVTKGSSPTPAIAGTRIGIPS